MEKTNSGTLVKKPIHGDEYYSPQNVVDLIVPYVVRGGYKSIWCPFDKPESLFVQTFKKLGVEVIFGHIETGQDFFDYKEPQAEIVVSNPPFSKRDLIFERLYEMNVPFALVTNFNGLFDSRKRRELFRKNKFEILIPNGRMRFWSKNYEGAKHPSFQSVYICYGVLNEQIVFDDYRF